MVKLNRNASLLVQDPPIELANLDVESGQIVSTGQYVPSGGFTKIDYPLTIQFDIERTTSSSPNYGNFRITNLAQTTYERLAKDMYNINDFGSGKEYRQVIFSAGYQELSTIFQGSLVEGWTERSGTEIITHLRCQDGLYQIANAYTSQTFQAGTSMNDIFKTLLQDLGLQQGIVGTIPENQSPLRAAAYNGNTFQLLRDNFNNRVFIDLEKTYLLADDEVILGQVPLISSETGLLGVPRRQNTYIQVDIIFEPRIQIGQIVEVVSKIDPRFNGQWKVQGIKHSGTISGAIGGDCKTTLQLFYGTKALGGLTLVE